VSGLLGFLIALLAVAALLRIDFFFYLFYLIAGVALLGRAWAQRAARSLACERRYPGRVFWGERPLVELTIRNRGLLPVLWLQVHDSLPIQVRSPNFYQQVVSLGPREALTLSYQLDCRRRGYYPLGPLALESGDLLGTARIAIDCPRADTLVVYPRIIPLAGLRLPSRTMYGSLPSRQRIFEDPARILGLRDYVPGDSLRHIAWKSSAALGRLQVRRLEPSVALETAIMLDLCRGSYSPMRLWVATELAIVVAASVANWLVERRQAVGLATNGCDPLAAAEGAAGQPPAKPPRKGRLALMALLDLLARVEMAEGTTPLAALLRREAGRLPWGATLVVITGRVDEALFDALASSRRAGLSAALISVDPGPDFAALRRRAARIGVPSFEVWEETDLERGCLAAGGAA